MTPRLRAAAVLAAVAGLNVVAWTVFAVAVLPHGDGYPGLGVGLGVGLTAWTLGMRHAFDADHIAAIDIATRKLLADGRSASGTGFFFALGHASVVMVLAVGIVVGGRYVFDVVSAPGSSLTSGAGLIATTFASVFLLTMAAANVRVIAAIVTDVRAVGRGDLHPAQLETRMQVGGPLMRVFGRFARGIGSSRQLFGVGFLFGISFETATEVMLFASTAVAVGNGVPWLAVLSLPLLFAGGLTLFDSLNGLFVGAAYRWAFTRPAGKVLYNLTVTALSVAVAVLVGGVQLLRVASEHLHLHGWAADGPAALDLSSLGYVVVALVALVWLGAFAVWRLGRVEARWDAAVEQAR